MLSILHTGTESNCDQPGVKAPRWPNPQAVLWCPGRNPSKGTFKMPSVTEHQLCGRHCGRSKDSKQARGKPSFAGARRRAGASGDATTNSLCFSNDPTMLRQDGTEYSHREWVSSRWLQRGQDTELPGRNPGKNEELRWRNQGVGLSTGSRYKARAFSGDLDVFSLRKPRMAKGDQPTGQQDRGSEIRAQH